MQQNNAAYDLSTFAPRPERQRQELRVVRSEKEKKGLLSRFDLKWIKAVALASIMIALVCSVLFSQTKATELSANIVSVQSNLADSQSEYTYLSNQMEMKTNLKTVEEYVSGQLGLVQLDKAQLTYVSAPEENRIERQQTGIALFANEISHGALSFMEYLTP